MKTKKTMLKLANEYIRHKQGLGFKFESPAFHIRSYAKYADENFPGMPLLVCTGMRIGEVVALKEKDVDLESGIITIKQFKKMPKRLIPVSDSVKIKLAEYRDAQQKLLSFSKTDAFFKTADGGAVPYPSFNNSWRKILRKAGINNGHSTPRAHDLRHTFACNHLLRAYKENRDIDDAIYMLSVYLGHTVIQGTYWYLSATSEILEQCVKRVEKSLSPKKKEVNRENKQK